MARTWGLPILCVLVPGFGAVPGGWGLPSPVESPDSPLCLEFGLHCERWTRTFDGPTQAADGAGHLAFDPLGRRVYVAGSSETDFHVHDLDVQTLAYDLGLGTELWSARYDGLDHLRDTPQDVAVSADGETVFVAAVIERAQGPRALAVLIAYEADSGSKLWEKDLADRGAGVRLAATPDGSVLVACVGRLDGSDLLALIPRTGTELWRAGSPGLCGTPDQLPEGAPDMAMSPDGSRVFLTANDFHAGTFHVTAHATATGAVSWQAVHAAAPEVAATLPLGVVSGLDTVYLVSNQVTPFLDGFRWQPVIMALDQAGGRLRWVRVLELPESQSVGAFASEIAVDAGQERVLIAGQHFQNVLLGGFNGAVAGVFAAALDAGDGALLWKRSEFGPAGLIRLRDTALSPDGSRFYLAATSQGGTWDGALVPTNPGSDVETWGYAAEGGELAWKRTYSSPPSLNVEPCDPGGLFTDGPLDFARCLEEEVRMIRTGDVAQAMGVSPDGESVIVTGYGEDGANTGADFVTLAYGR